MDFYDWRKGVIAQLTYPFRYENPRWGRRVFIPSGTRFRTEHTRRGPPENFFVPVSIIDDVHLYEKNMTPSQEKLYPAANFLFQDTTDTPLRAELLDDTGAHDEFFAVERLTQVHDAIPYLAQGKAVNYLVQLANKGFEQPSLIRRTGARLERVDIGPSWYTNVSRVVKVQIAEHAVRGMKTRIKQNLTPEHEIVWFVTVSRFFPKGEGVQRMRVAYNDFRQMLSPGAVSASYLTEAKSGLVSPPGLDCASFYAFIHSDEDRVLMRIAYADDLIVQDLTV